MENLWTRVVKRKYIDQVPLEEWIRNGEEEGVSDIESNCGVIQSN